MVLSQHCVIIDNYVILTKFTLFLQHFLCVDINVNILKLLILTFLLVSFNILTYCISELLFIIVSGAIVRYSFKNYFNFKNGNDPYIVVDKPLIGTLEGCPDLDAPVIMEIVDKAPVATAELNLDIMEQLIAKPVLTEVLDNSAQLSNIGTNLGWWILGGVIIVGFIIIGAKIYNNVESGADISNSVANLNDKLIKIDSSTSLKINELNDRVTSISTRVTKIEDYIKIATESLDSRVLNGTKQALSASKLALESSSIAEAAYLGVYNLSKTVPNLEDRIEAIEKHLSDS
jgi:hypothetical protein